MSESEARAYDARYRCRYCGAPCRDHGVCYAHSDVWLLDAETRIGDPDEMPRDREREDTRATRERGA